MATDLMGNQVDNLILVANPNLNFDPKFGHQAHWVVSQEIIKALGRLFGHGSCVHLSIKILILLFEVDVFVR